MDRNPYTPGAGFMPVFLAGRETVLNNADRCLHNIKDRYPQQSIIYHGLHGVGKTVLLNEIESYADNLGILRIHLEVDDGKDKRFTKKLLVKLEKCAREISTKKKFEGAFQNFSDLLSTFLVTFSPDEQSFSLSLTGGVTQKIRDYADDLTDIFIELGKLAKKSGDTICFFIDEVQYLSETEFGALIAAIHRCNQLRLPIMAFCAGLPKIVSMAASARTYAERLFVYEHIDSLTAEETEAAIREPAKDSGVEYSQQAIDRIVKITGGYPYFVQQFCSVIWEQLTQSKYIEITHVQKAEEEFFQKLDRGFFLSRYDRCTHNEKIFMTAMVKCGELPCTIANVASIMGRQVKSISPIRGQLISKGMIYSVGRGEINFTVPQFDNYIKRLNPKLEF